MKVIWSNSVMSRSTVFEVCYPAASLNHAVLSPCSQRTLTRQPIYNLCKAKVYSHCRAQTHTCVHTHTHTVHAK